MLLLDCGDVHSTAASLSAALGVSSRSLVRAIKSYDGPRLESGLLESPFEMMPRQLLGEFGASMETTLRAFVGASYFHGTRSPNPRAFAVDGILPLGSVLDAIWSHLRGLAGRDISDTDWAAFRRALGIDAGGHDGCLYRLKATESSHWGPYAMLVREALLHPGEAGIHDYLNGPEIIEDITRAIALEYRLPLMERFMDSTSPCIVKFHARSLGANEVRSAIWYLYSRLRKEPLTNVSQGGFSGIGIPVPPDSISAVEVISGSS